mmetsp:Transcript_22272/g.28573  ORF Transcript_22272/g.28573 Transcript_22272/m.28573 type:complete len:424 (-) Transcript_22272:169-1440(-)
MISIGNNNFKTTAAQFHEGDAVVSIRKRSSLLRISLSFLLLLLCRMLTLCHSLGGHSNGLRNGQAMKAATTSIPPYPVRVTVMGGGNFGLALATVLGRKGVPTTLLVRKEEIANHLNTKHCHPQYMSDIQLPSTIVATADPKNAFSDATYVIHAVPCQFSREFLSTVKDYIPPYTPVLSASKGIETGSLGFMTDIMIDCLGPDRSYAFLSGPSFAREICEGVATAVVIASKDLFLADDLAVLMSSDTFRCFTSCDVIGVEVGGAVKNVIALAAGMCEGLGLGTNAMSGLVTRGCTEMRRLGDSLGAKPNTLSGLSGVGDTFGTCFGPLSRNRKFGYRLGKGETMSEILESTTEVAEGVDTSIALVRMIKEKCKGYRLDLKYPILFGVADILQGTLTPAEGLERLMNMPIRMENYEGFSMDLND